MRLHVQRVFTLLALSVLLAGDASSQVATGTYQFGSFGGGPFDTVNLGNLNVRFVVPVLSKAGRGLPFVYDIAYDSSVWYPTGTNGNMTWAHDFNWGWKPQGANTVGYITVHKQVYNCDNPQPPYHQYTTWDFWVYHNPWTGATTPLAGMLEYDPTGCDNGTTSTMTATATDGTGITINAALNIAGALSQPTIVTTDGHILTPAVNPTTGVSFTSANHTDANGNQISVSASGVFTDTLGTPALTVTGSATASSPVKLSYPSPASPSTQVFYQINYKNYNIKTAFACTGILDVTLSNAPLVDTIALPDGSSYSLAYEVTPGNSAYVTGRIQSVTLPTGGSITYSYSGSNNGITCSDGSTAGLTRVVSPGGSWSYTRTFLSGVNWKTTATDPQGNDTVLSFTKDTGLTHNYYETYRQSYNGSSTGGSSAILTTVLTSLYGQSNIVVTPFHEVDVSRYWGDLSGTSFSTTKTTLNGYQLPLVVTEAGRTTTYTYATLGNNIVGKPSQVQVADSGGTVQSTVQYSYDGSGVTTTTGTPQHTGITGARGNLTQTASFKSASSAPVTLYRTYTYYDTGTLASSSALGTAAPVSGTGTTTFTYGSGSCGNSFPTQVSTSTSTSAALASSSTWDCNGAIQLSSTDPNGATSSATFADANFWRPTVLIDPLNKQTAVSYPSTTASEAALSFNGGSSVIDVRSVSDAMGRGILTQVLQGPGATQYDTAQTDYDSSGRVQRTTLPFSAAANGTNSTAPGTTYTYDALSRPLSTTDSRGGTVTYSYAKGDVQQTVGPAPVGESAKSKQLEYDGLGHLISVCEITTGNTRTPAGACGQTTSQNGYLTKYTYDVFNNITNVSQNSQIGGTAQTRTYTYDWLSRLTQEVNPENGTTTYAYDKLTGDAACGTVNYPGQLVKKTDAYNNMSCYAYDAVGRLTGITYPSGPYAASTPTKVYVYDASSAHGTTLNNTLGRLAEAYTCSGSPCTTKADTYFSYSKRGEVTDVWESTPNSAGTYHVQGSYFDHGALNALSMVGVTGMPTIYYGGNADASGLDGEGRYTKVTASSGTNPAPTLQYSTSSTTNILGALSEVTFGSQDFDSFTLDSQTGRASQYQFSVGTAPQTVTGALNWNANGTMKQLQVTDQPTPANSQICNFGYDDLGRLGTGLNNGTSNNVNCGSAWAQSISFDSLGNIVKAGSSNFAANYSTATNRLTSIGASAPVYDPNGNLTNDTFYSYAWDAEGKMISAGGASTATVTYDALNRQVEKKVGSVYTQTLYGLDSSKLALMSGQTLQKAFIAIPGGGTALYTNAGGAQPAYYRHPDWLGSARLTTTSSRTVYSDAQYAPFGEAYPTTPSAPLDQSFTGQNPDTVAQLDDFLFREYSPTQGRWMSPDPSGLAVVNPANPQSWNRYAYVVGNPLSLIDPLGLDCIYVYEDGSTYVQPGDCSMVTDSGYYVDGTVTPGSVVIDPTTGDLASYGFTDANGIDYSGAPLPPGVSPLDDGYSPTFLSTDYVMSVNGAGTLNEHQCAALKKTLATEAQQGTRAAAQAALDNAGTPNSTFMEFNNPIHGNVSTIRGNLDVDWFTHVAANSLSGGVGANAVYIGGKALWTTGKLITGQHTTNPLPYQDPGERNAVSAVASGKGYSYFFPPQVMEAACPTPK